MVTAKAFELGVDGETPVARKKLKVGRDHVQRQANTSPFGAIEELIWNGLDAGGRRVEVRLIEDQMHSVSRVEVEDRGTGIPPDEVDRAFGTIGESTKLKKKTTLEGRSLHGREGRGRFKALAVCPNPLWRTTFKSDGEYLTYSITFRRQDPDYYETTDTEPAKQRRTGTTVILDCIDHGQLSLPTEDTQRKLTEKFAYYLTKYPDTSVVYDGRRLATRDVIDRQETFDIGGPEDPSEAAKLTIIEWRFRPEAKKLHICNEDGFSYHEVPMGVPGRGIEFTAYVCTAVAMQWADDNRFVLGELDNDITALVDVVREHVTYVGAQLNVLAFVSSIGAVKLLVALEVFTAFYRCDTKASPVVNYRR